MLKRGFSLMEMMIVMLIVAVVAAASAPMINKKMLQDQANDSPWVWTGTDNSIAYNLKGNATQTAVIGAIKAPTEATKSKTKLHIESEETQLTLKKKGMAKSFQFKVDGTDGSSIYIVDDSTNLPIQPNNVAIGNKITASSYPNMTLIGAETYGEHFSTALGYKAYSKPAYGGGGSSTAIGTFSKTDGNRAVAIGASANTNDATKATGKYALAVGSGARASGESSIAIGGVESLTYATKAETTGSIAIGKAAKANTNAYTTALGSYASATGLNSTALGYSANATSEKAIAIGDAEAIGTRSIAIGSHRGTGTAQAIASKTDSIAIGLAKAQGLRAIAIGSYDDCGSMTHADGTDSIAMGKMAYAPSNYTISIGANTWATEENSMAIGYKAKSLHENSTAIGTGATTTASNQIVLGTSADTVYIPGKLIVDGKSKLLGGVRLKMVRGSGNNDGTLEGDLEYYNHATGSFKAVGLDYSDRRLKNVGEVFKAGLAEIKKLEVFNYTFKDDKDKTPRVGVMAQDLQKIFPKAVFKGEDGFLRIRMEDMFYALVNAVKELDAKINLLEQKQKRIDELEKRLEKLEKRLEKLEKDK